MDEPVKGPSVVCSGFIERDGKFLLVFCPGFRVWRVPGGRAEWGEDIEKSFIREMKEELGVLVSKPRFLGYGQDSQYHVRAKRETSRLLMFFHAKVSGEISIDPDEAEESKWVTLEEMRKQKNVEGALADFLRKNPGLKI